MAIKVGMVSLGCSKNQVDAELMLSMIQKEGFELRTEPGLCDVVIVNTCGFIEDAKKESIENILEFGKLKEEGRIKVIVVTGCLAERYREELIKEIPEADVVLGIGSNQSIVDAIKRALNGEKVVEFAPKENLMMNGDRVISNLPFYAYLRIADGCDNCCTYCAIPMIRGAFRSRRMEDIVAEAKKLVENGVRELNVIAQDTTRYGEDLYGEYKLPELLRQLCEIPDLKWIRLLYCYPQRITDELIQVVKEEPKIVKYFDIPIQHISDPVLKAMNRQDTEAELRELFAKIRNEIPDVVLRTTMLVGFPGESKKDFEKLCLFVREQKFERLGCFAFSPEEGTPAAEMPNQHSQKVRARRAEIVMEEQYACAQHYCQRQVGKTLEVAVEGYDKYASCYFGRSAADAPDIDPKVFFASKRRLKIGEFVSVLIEDSMEYDLLGTVVE